MKILVLNCGSSTLKFQLVETDPASGSISSQRKLAGGLVERDQTLVLVHYVLLQVRRTERGRVLEAVCLLLPSGPERDNRR